MNKPPAISVLIAVYNTPFYLAKRAIDSVLNQDFDDWDLILIDDGSDNDPNNQLLDYAKKHGNIITYIRHHNCGQSRSINRGVRNCNGNYIAILDADDEYMPNHLTNCMLQMNNADLIASTTLTIVDKEEDYYVPDKHDNSKLIHVDDCVLFATLFGTREVFSSLQFQNIYAADAHFFEQAALRFRVKKVNLRSYIYYRNIAGSITANLKIKTAKLLFNKLSPFTFLPGLPLVMACHITGVFDVNRNNILADDDFTYVEAWAASLKAQQVNGIIFHNSFSAVTCAAQQHKHLHFIRIEANEAFNPNVYRYIIYREFLRLHATKITSLFVTDIADVVMVQNPFAQPLFIANAGKLFCGDEPITLHNEWMINHAAHLRNNIADYASYETAFKDFALLNCGIIGGNSLQMQIFIEQLAALHEQYNCNNSTAYTGDMGAFNYLVRSRFNDHFIHGFPVNSIFKAYQNERKDCWFRHK